MAAGDSEEVSPNENEALPVQTRQHGRRRSSALAAILSTFFYNDSEDVKVSPLTCARASEPEGEHAVQSSDPHDRSAMLARLRTFHPANWFAKPSEVSALTCASHGWINSGMNQLTCPSCKKTLTFNFTRTALRGTSPAVSQFAKQLRSGHHERCPWAHAQAESSALVAFPTAPPHSICEAYVDRLSQLAMVDALPPLAEKGISKLLEHRLSQFLALLDSQAVPVQAPGLDSRFDAHQDVNTAVSTLQMLSRRSCSFSQAAKLLALLGWTITPLAGAKPLEDNLYPMSSCMISCSACGAVVGLWSYEAAPDTHRTLGCHGLLGTWGPGPAVAHPLKAISIAGALSDDSPGNGDQGKVCSGSNSHSENCVDGSCQQELRQSSGVFGSNTDVQVFGSKISLAASAMSSEQPFGSKTTQQRTTSAAPVGSKRKHSSSGNQDCHDGSNSRSDVNERFAKVMRKLSAHHQGSLSADMHAKLRSRGLYIGSSAAVDIVHSHRPWCPWIAPDKLEGWYRTLNAIVPEDVVTSAGGEEQAVANADEDINACNVVNQVHKASHTSLLHQVGGFLSRLNKAYSSQEDASAKT